MQRFTLVTGSAKKTEEFQAMLPEIEIETSILEIDEIQSMSLKEIAKKKAQAAFEILRRPVVVDDTGFYLDELKGLPGPFIKYFEDQFPNDSLIRLLGDSKNRKGYAETCIAYCDGKYDLLACGEVHGIVTTDVCGPEGAFGFDYCFVPEGYDKTFAELGLEIKNQISHRANALKAFKYEYDKVFAG